MRNDDEHERLRRVVGRIAGILSRGETVTGPLEAELAAACRRAVLAEIRALFAKVVQQAREHDVLKRSTRSWGKCGPNMRRDQSRWTVERRRNSMSYSLRCRCGASPAR